MNVTLRLTLCDMPRVLIIPLILVVACGVSSPTTTTTLASTSTSAVPASSTTGTSSTDCPEDRDFVSSGRIARITQPASDSRTLGLISAQTAGECEQFGFDFETAENAPATTPPTVNAEFLDGERIIRIHLGIDRTVITDQLVETRLVDRLYVVRALDGSMFIDIHLAQAVIARIDVSNSPASLNLGLSPRASVIGPSPSVSDDVVVIQPTQESDVAGPDVVVSGYARVFEANVLIVATNGNQVAARESTTAADWIDTWGEFETSLTLPPGPTDLFVGEESPENGSLDGVIFKLTVR